MDSNQRTIRAYYFTGIHERDFVRMYESELDLGFQHVFFIGQASMFITYHSESMDQPSKVVNHARGQLSREKIYSLSPFVPENLL